jgi:hypothetical protein
MEKVCAKGPVLGIEYCAEPWSFCFAIICSQWETWRSSAAVTPVLLRNCREK